MTVPCEEHTRGLAASRGSFQACGRGLWIEGGGAFYLDVERQLASSISMLVS